MGCLRVLLLLIGAILLLPGVCFVAIGGLNPGQDARQAIAVGVVILLVAGGLLWQGFRMESPRDDRGRDDGAPHAGG